MIDLISIPTRVLACEERKKQTYLSGYGESATFAEVSLGWWVTFEGSHEALHAGDEDPGWRKGDDIVIIAKRVNNAKPK